MFLIGTENGLEEFCMILWNIWLARNKAVFKQKETKAEDILERALSNLLEFINSDTRDRLPATETIKSKRNSPLRLKASIKVMWTVLSIKERQGWGWLLEIQWVS